MMIIDHPTTGEKLQVANSDFILQYNWNDALNDALTACLWLGSGWRLSTLEELEAIRCQLWQKKN